MNQNNNQSGLLKVHDYSEKELKDFTDYSFAGKNYLRLLQQKNIPKIYYLRHQAWLETAMASYFDNASSQSLFFQWSSAMDHILQLLRVEHQLDQEHLDLIALGKWGSSVLNLSSDIDLVFTSKNITPSLLTKTRKFLQSINNKTEWGFISRTDLDLKPSTLNDRYICTPDVLVNYLWNSRELWERLVYTRARKVFFSTSEENDYFPLIRKFCYRKYVNMSLVESLSDLMAKILSHNHDDNNLKLRAGGIRSIELFLCSLQLLYGGRDEDLQCGNTYDLLAVVGQKNYIKIDSLSTLTENYNLLRRSENLVQMLTDSQDHTINEQIPVEMKQVNKACKQNAEIIKGFIDSIINRNRQGRQNKTFINDLSMDTEKFPHLVNFKTFLEKRPTYKDLISSHPHSFENFLNALKYSPYLTRILLLRPDLFDLYLTKKTLIRQEEDDETFLSQLVDFKLLNYITASGEFLTHFDVEKLTKTLSLTSDQCLSLTLKKVFPDQEDLNILKLGKWASHEVGLKSDLDFVFLCEDKNINLKKIRKLIHYIGHHTFHGPFYSIDLRLRPSGNAGPIVTTLERLKTYVESPNTPAWIKQSYLRNAFLNGGHKKLNLEYDSHSLSSSQIHELLEIREKRLKKINSQQLSVKESQGGLIDLEFFIQHLCLANKYFPLLNSFSGMCSELCEQGFLNNETADKLLNLYKYLRTVEQICCIKSSTEDLVVTKKNSDFIFDLPEKSKEYFQGPVNFEKIKELLTESRELIQNHHPFLL